MATSMQRKISSDVAADVSSADSLSFAGLVCIQDQHSKPQIGHAQPRPRTKHDPDFEFGHAIPGLAAGSPGKVSPADLLFSNGQLLPQAIPSHLSLSQVLSHASSKDSLPPTRRGRSSNSSCRTSSDNELGFNKAAKKPENEVRNQANKDLTNGNRSFGQKTFKSFSAPCRSCRVLEPSPKVQTLQQIAKLQ